MASATNQMMFPDLHHKMSKKIAQLTKVIYHLNSKNEDHQDDLTGLADAYETEIDGILKDAYTKINTFKQKLEERKEVEKQQQAVDEFKAQHEREKKEALAAFESYKTKVKEREIGLKAECEDKVAKAAATLESVKSDFKTRVDEFNAAVKKMEAKGGSQVEDLIKRHKAEIAEHVTTSNAKYNEMLKERMNEEDKLHDEIARLKKELAAAAAAAMKDAEAEISKRVKHAKA
ncbi:MAG: hypothetical protein ACPIOQ_21440, partial [Promethearchaeia archaeon]